jgi:hypothetical protein
MEIALYRMKQRAKGKTPELDYTSVLRADRWGKKKAGRRGRTPEDELDALELPSGSDPV